MQQQVEIAVLGAGLTGATAALALARAGRKVALVEQDPLAMNRASLRNEGKIHLGFIYANDASLTTARLMQEGALVFRAILARLAGAAAASPTLSTPFTYLVAPDSVLSPAVLEQRYRAIERSFVERLRQHPELDYLGRRPESLVEPAPLSRYRTHLRVERFAAAFQTVELAIDTAPLALAVRAAIAAAPGLGLLAGRRVTAVERDGERFQVIGESAGGPWRLAAAQVVNALWENRLKIDRTAGLAPPPGWLHRLKYRVIARLPAALRDGPSISMVLGPYGDVVIRPDGTAFFSWYPVGLRGWSHELAPPDAWDAPCRSPLAGEAARAVADDILGAIDAWYPGARDAEPLAVDAGAIVAYGRTDVDDPRSGLHDRSRQVGVTSDRGYHSVDPGKLTTAPLFGLRAAEAVLAEAARR